MVGDDTIWLPLAAFVVAAGVTSSGLATRAAAWMDPAAAAFASTAAAGFCHTLPSSAKPVALFSRVEGVEAYGPRDLLRLSAHLAPMTAALVLLFAYTVWPALGLSLR